VETVEAKPNLRIPANHTLLSRADQQETRTLRPPLAVKLPIPKARAPIIPLPSPHAVAGSEEGRQVVDRKVLYLIRHGEAVHNIEERKAKQLAAASLKAEGFSPTSCTYKDAVEAARCAVLHDRCLLDAALSDAGKSQACSARSVIDDLVNGPNDQDFPWPTVVLTSPLQRTLQTSAIVFPKHPGVHIREALRERRTGLPCDERRSALRIRSRPSFVYMSSNDLLNFDLDCGCGEVLSPCPENSEMTSPPMTLEDKEDVRRRSAGLPLLLQGFEDDEAVAIVTHKGFLRELERGLLGRPEATEFGNCEVRVYDVTLHADGTLHSKLLYGGLDDQQVE